MAKNSGRCVRTGYDAVTTVVIDIQLLSFHVLGILQLNQSIVQRANINSKSITYYDFSFFRTFAKNKTKQNNIFDTEI